MEKCKEHDSEGHENARVVLLESDTESWGLVCRKCKTCYAARRSEVRLESGKASGDQIQGIFPKSDRISHSDPLVPSGSPIRSVLPIH
jgi:hypothetical protein